MKTLYIKNYSLAKEIIIISVMIFIILISSIVILSLNSFSKYKKIQIINYNSQVKLIDNMLGDNINNLSNYMKFIGQKIINLENKDLNNISKILINKIPDNLIEEAIFSWTLFDYVDENKMMIFNSIKGIIKPPIDMSSREHLASTKITPWKLFFSPPVIGIPSNEYVIPAGMGFKQNNNFYGTLVIGIRLNKIREKIEKILDNHSVSYILVDKKFNIINFSSNFKLPNNLSQQSLKNYFISSKLYQKEIIIDNFEFSQFHPLKSLPYQIILGQNIDTKIENILNQILPNILQLFLIAISLILMLYVLKNRITKPILNLTDLATNIKNNKPISIIQSRYQEINLLTKELLNIRLVKNKLIRSQSLLKKANLRIKKNNLTLEKKVAARTFELQEALEAKTEFLNNMSHEIRTPIQGFTGISEGLVQHWNEFNDLEKRDLVNKIYFNSKRLYLLIGNLLDLSKFNQGQMLLFPTNVDLNILIENLIDECKSLYLQDKKIEFKFKKINIIDVIIDQERIAQVFRNIFINAIKYSPNNSLITIHIKESKINHNNIYVEAIHLTIIDQGIGIPKTELKTIFESFKQSSRTKTKAGGTGLGLAIALKIIEAHNGKIWAENNKIRGTTFNVIIPKIYYNENEKILADGEIADPKLLKNNFNILMIDDEESCLVSMELLLFKTNFKLFKTTNAKNAFKYLKNNNIDLILLDLMMPEIYGLNLLNQLKKSKNYSNIPVILQSGSIDDREIKKAHKMGITAHIKKPYEKNEVLRLIKKALNYK